MSKDYYKILGVTEFDSVETIKSAYRTLARKWHPDIAGNNPDVMKRFKEINEAYQILSNNVKKEEYDKARKFYNYANKETEKTTSDIKYSSNPQEKKDEKQNFKFCWEDFLYKKNKTNAYKTEEKKVPVNGKDLYADIDISVMEAFSGITKSLNVLQRTICPKCKGRKFVNNAKCSHCNGKGEFSIYKKFNVKIPSGIKNNSKIRLAEEGEKGLYGGKNGDLYIKVHIIEDKKYRIEDLNIIKTVFVTPYEAVLGTTIKINTINKGLVSLKINPNTQNGQKIRLAECGLVQKDKIGDMIITIEVEIPLNLSQEEINLYKQLKEISSHKERENF